MFFLGLFHLSVVINNNGYYFVILMFHTFRPICKSVVHMFRFSHEAALTYAIATYIKKIKIKININCKSATCVRSCFGKVKHGRECITHIHRVKLLHVAQLYQSITTELMVFF